VKKKRILQDFVNVKRKKGFMFFGHYSKP